MIVTRNIAVRIALIVLLGVVLQTAFFSTLNLLGASPNVVPVLVVSLGLLGGALVGAVCGFAAGLLLDSMLLQTLGVSSLVLLSIGYLSGRYREGLEITNRWAPPLLAGGFTLLAAGGFAALQLMLGVEGPVSLLVLREIVVQAILAVLFAIPIYPLVRRVLAPALIDYAPSGGFLSPGLRRRSRRGRRDHPARTHEARHQRPRRGRARVSGGIG